MTAMLGIYIHIPFCAGRCAYCDFYTCAGRDDRMGAYQEALLRHIREAQPYLRRETIDTVYFGGGTPSYYGAERLCELLDALKDSSRLLVDAEVTAEVNPGTVTRAQLKKLRRGGFNRLSVGVQSANDGILRSQGRKHTFAEAVQTVREARAVGFDNISCDLIYGLPSQTREDWADSLLKVAALRPEHISCYGLKIAEGTPLWPYRDSPYLPSGDDQADMYLYAVETLVRYGYHQYEISNFALRRRESRHNLKYWRGGDYMGFGAAAHSCVGNVRYSNVSDLDRYIRAVLEDGEIIDHREEIKPFERGSEYLMLGLRTVRGISEKEYRERYNCDFSLIRGEMERFCEHGWALETGGRWHFTPQGFLVSNILIGDVLDAHARQRELNGTPWVRDLSDPEGEHSRLRDESGSAQLFRGI